MKDCIASLPQAHRATLAYLLRHLIRVTELKETNRMQIPNLAIVFGPTLMWPPSSLVTRDIKPFASSLTARPKKLKKFSI
jgi:hypothetical protein